MTLKELALALEKKFNQNKEKFFSDLYRLDINEKKVRHFLDGNLPNAFEQIAQLVLDRELLKSKALPQVYDHAEIQKLDDHKYVLNVSAQAFPSLLEKTAVLLQTLLKVETDPHSDNSTRQEKTIEFTGSFPQGLTKNFLEELCSLFFIQGYWGDSFRIEGHPISEKCFLKFSGFALTSKNTQQWILNEQSIELRFENSHWHLSAILNNP